MSKKAPGPLGGVLYHGKGERTYEKTGSGVCGDATAGDAGGASAGAESSAPAATYKPNSEWLQLSGRVQIAAKQSSTAHGGDAARAIDGNADTNWGGNSCTHTSGSASETYPFWEVDLGRVHTIEAVKITARGDCCGDRLLGFAVLVDGKACSGYNLHVQKGRTEEFVCSPVRTGRKIRVQKYKAGPLTICEFDVKGTPGVQGTLAGGSGSSRVGSDGK